MPDESVGPLSARERSPNPHPPAAAPAAAPADAATVAAVAGPAGRPAGGPAGGRETMASDTVQQPEPSGRKYRSKKQRPCDLCRSRKIHCKLPGNETVCECCKRLNRVCTFALEPLKRRSRPEAGVGVSQAQIQRAGDVSSVVSSSAVAAGPGVVSSVAPLSGATPAPILAAIVAAPTPVPVHTPQQQQQQQQQQAVSIDEAHGVDAVLLDPQLDQHHQLGDHGDTSMALDMPPFWLPDSSNGSNFFSPRGLAEMDHLLLQSPPNMVPAMESSISPASGTESTSPMNVFHQNGMINGNTPANTNHNHANGTGSTAESPAAIRRESMTHYDQETQDALMQHYTNGMNVHVSPGSNQFAPWQQPDWSKEFSLESQRGYSHHMIGVSCESDPYLLRYYYYNNRDLYTMFRLDFRRMADDATIHRRDGTDLTHQPPPPSSYVPIQFAMTDEDILQDGIKEVERTFGDNSTEQQDIALLKKLVPPDLGERLIRLYTRCVHPRFPVLSLSDLSKIRQPDGNLSVPVGLLSAVYALAMPFTFLDDELSLFKAYLQVPTDDLWAIAHRSYLRASCLCHLSLLQLCLLLLQRPPNNYAVAATPGFWALSCSAVSIAETLGVNMDPSSWRLPRQEIVLRRRLWWMTFTHHVWYAIGLARPCHINDSNWDVDELTVDDFEEDHADPYIKEAIATEIPVLLAHCHLTVIAADVLKEFYTFKAIRKATSLSVLLSRAQPLRTRIESWRQTLPLLSKPALELTEDDLVIGASLRMSHLTLEVLIFRALLRPLVHDAVPVDNGVVQEPMSTIYENCSTCAKVGMEIIASMKGKHFSTFWPCYVRYQLCYISNFILLSLAQSPTRDIAVRNKDLLNKWRDTLRTQARAWPLARLATIRLDAIFWKGLTAVFVGTGADSPAMKLLTEMGITHKQ